VRENRLLVGEGVLLSVQKGVGVVDAALIAGQTARLLAVPIGRAQGIRRETARLKGLLAFRLVPRYGQPSRVAIGL
jgi:hypothetical protein